MKKYFTSLLLGILTSLPFAKLVAQENERQHLVTLALEKSNLVQIQQYEVRSAVLDRSKAFQTYIPNVTWNASYTRLNDDIQFTVPVIQIPIGPNQVLEKQLDPITLQKKDIFKTDLSATWVLMSGLKVPRLASASYHNQLAKQQLVRKEETEVIKEVLDAYDKYALLLKSLEVLEESQKRLDKQTEYATKAAGNGLISSYDLNKIKIAQQEIKAREIELDAQQALILSHLNKLTGTDRETLAELTPVLTPWIIEIEPLAVQNRPELMALDEGIKATASKKKAEVSDYMPQVFAFAKYELYREDLSALDPYYYAGVGMRWSVFDGFQNVRDIQKAEIEKNIMMRKKDEAEALFNLNFEKSVSDLSVTNQLIEVARIQEENAREGLKIREEQYRVGLTGINDRLIAETDFHQAQLQHLKAIYEQRKAAVRYLEANGKLDLSIIK